MSMVKLIQETTRLLILETLTEMPGYSAADTLIDEALDSKGHFVSFDEIKTAIAWLERQGLLTTSVSLDTNIAKITQSGIDAAKGQAMVPGVRRPRP